MALGSTQPLTEMSTGSISWGKGGRCVRLTTYHHPVLLSRNLGTLISWNPLGLSRPVTGLLYLFTSFSHFLQAKKALRVSRGIALLFLGPRYTRFGWGVSPTLRPPLLPGKTRQPLYRRLGGSQGRSGRRKISSPPGFDPEHSSS